MNDPITISLATALSLTALTLLATIVATLHADTVDTVERAEVRRLTAPLPPEYVSGRHRPEHFEARGTEAQRRLYDTMEISLADVARAVAR